MAKLAVTVTVIFFLFAFSHARIPILSPENDVSHLDRLEFSPESDSKLTLRLPSEKRKSDLVFVVDLEDSRSEIAEAETKPIRSETKSIDSGDDLPDSETVRPLTYFRFRPVNRHFRRGCRGHHHHHNKQLSPAVHGGEISYGNDMLVAGENNEFDTAKWTRFDHHHLPKQVNTAVHGGEISYGNDMLVADEKDNFDPEVVDGSVRQIPVKWIRFDHHHRHHHDGASRFPFRHHDVFAKQKFKRRFHFHHDQDEKEEKEERVEREEGGFMKRFRKFLNHF